MPSEKSSQTIKTDSHAVRLSNVGWDYYRREFVTWGFVAEGFVVVGCVGNSFLK